jgi:molybdopterin synthase sulfur carrier subunit
MTLAIQLLAFGGTKTIVGATELRFPIGSACTTGELLDEICRRYPGLEPQRQSLRLAVNGAYAGMGQRVSPGDEVALIPPVAGG